MPALVDNAILLPNSVLTQLDLPGLRLQLQAGEWRQLPLSTATALSSQPQLGEIKALIDAWVGAQALEVSQYGSDVAESNIELFFADGAKMELEILARHPELILGRRDLGLRYHFSADQAEHLLMLPKLPGRVADEG
jgi:hypothetical protein